MRLMLAMTKDRMKDGVDFITVPLKESKSNNKDQQTRHIYTHHQLFLRITFL